MVRLDGGLESDRFNHGPFRGGYRVIRYLLSMLLDIPCSVDILEGVGELRLAKEYICLRWSPSVPKLAS